MVWGLVLHHEIEFSDLGSNGCEAPVIDSILPKKYGLVCSYEVMMIRWRTSYKYNIDVLIGFLQCREQYSESTWCGYYLTGPPERVNLNRIVKSLVPYDRLKKCGVKFDQIYIITRLV